MGILALISDLASFGAAGLMGAMWLCERRLSRRREEQLDDTHGRIARDEERLGKLTQVVEQNTIAITRFTEIQREMCETVRQAIFRRIQQEANHEKSK